MERKWKLLQSIGLYRGYIGMMEKKVETTKVERVI